MATAMAGHHSMSTLTNSCVKVPINPRNRLAATFTERGGSFKPSDEKQREKWAREAERGAADPGTSLDGELLTNTNGHRHNIDMEDDIENANYGGSQQAVHTDQMFENLTENIDSYTDEEFYRKLIEMKKEHRKTLQRLEKMYDKKLSLSGHEDVSRSSFEQEESPFTRSGPVYVGDHKLHHIDDEIEQFTKSQDWSAKKDNVRDMSAKPPIGRPKTAWSGKARRSLRRSASSEKWNDITWNSDTSGQDTSGSELDVASGRSRRAMSLSLSDSGSQAAHQGLVDKMWDGFSVNEYAPPARSRSRASSVKSAGSGTSAKAKEWSPKITVPKPFQMTRRDAAKDKSKSKACLEVEQVLAERQKAEEAECQRKFKATPAPAHTYLPLYDEIREKEMERSRKNQEQSKALLTTKQKPFDLTKREEEKKRHRRSQSLPLTSARERKPKQFKAREIPKSVFDPTVADRILEEEEYRKIRIKMRAEEMLRQSSLPENMKHRGREYTDGRLRQKLQKSRERKAFLTPEHKFRPQVNGEVPDYDQLYRQFQREVQRKKSEKEPTVAQPFNLRTARIPSKADKIRDELRAEEERRRETLRGSMSRSLGPRGSSGSWEAREDTIPTRTTTAAKLRSSVTEKTLREKAEREKEEAERERRKRLRERKLKQFIAKKALANDNSDSLSVSSKTKLHNYIQAGKSRQEEYDAQLKEMMARVDSRPLLFERQSQVNAQKAAERKYQQALKEAGVDEEFLARKGRGGSAQSYDDYAGGSDEADDEDYTYGGDLSAASSAARGRGSAQDASHSYDDYDDNDENRSISSIHTEED